MFYLLVILAIQLIVIAIFALYLSIHDNPTNNNTHTNEKERQAALRLAEKTADALHPPAIRHGQW